MSRDRPDRDAPPAFSLLTAGVGLRLALAGGLGLLLWSVVWWALQ